MSAKVKFTTFDRKAKALAAYLYYADREFDVCISQTRPAMYWELQVVRKDTRDLEPCPFLHDPSITCDEARVGYSDIVTTWTIPLM